MSATANLRARNLSIDVDFDARSYSDQSFSCLCSSRLVLITLLLLASLYHGHPVITKDRLWIVCWSFLPSFLPPPRPPASAATPLSLLRSEGYFSPKDFTCLCSVEHSKPTTSSKCLLFVPRARFYKGSAHANGNVRNPLSTATLFPFLDLDLWR